MSASVLEALFAHVQRVPAQDLQWLDYENVDWLPRIRPLRPEMIAQEIRRAVEASPSVSECLLRVAWLYCWLMSRRKIGPWMLIRFCVNVPQVDYHMLIGDLANALRSSPRRQTTLHVRHLCETYYACLINNYVDSAYLECGLMFLVLWRGQRFAAAYASTNLEVRALTTALHIALRGESLELLEELHEDLDAAFSAGRQDIGGPVLFRTDRRSSIMAQLFWHFD
ncbi:uncharacterized protein LOC119401969 isoform X2 [Rhipicephalus sanguineus]|uniref:uncharacterized protein LOC119401969 isoform X2 n=1 Tax=Rhipicephalus sanguineus TaxID=34632 RepID=UPI0020C268F1|nr:uncharacterized protein LOC119401969 isoform X2 [Rhipicephalus sanguineus]